MPDGRTRGISKISPELWLDPYDDAGWNYTVSNAFPLNPRFGERCFRTDIRDGMLFMWNGTYWLSDQQFVQDGPGNAFAATDNLRYMGLPNDLDVFLTRLDITYVVTPTNNGTNFWTATLRSWDFTTVDNVTGGSFNTSADGTAWIRRNLPLSYLVQGATGAERLLELNWTMTLSPSTIIFAPTITYKLRAV